MFGYLSGSNQWKRVNWRREWLWLYCLVHPQSGETKAWILPYVNTKLFSRVLKDFAQHFGVGKNKRIILALDQAGWHTSEQLLVPEGIHLIVLPSYSKRVATSRALVAFDE